MASWYWNEFITWSLSPCQTSIVVEQNLSSYGQYKHEVLWGYIKIITAWACQEISWRKKKRDLKES